MNEQGRVVGTTFEAQAERVLENLMIVVEVVAVVD